MLTETNECSDKLPYSITNELLETCINNGQPVSSSLNSFSCYKNEKNAGFLSDIYRLRLNWNRLDSTESNGSLSSTPLPPSSVILKIRTNRGMEESETLKNCDPQTVTLFRESLKHVHSNECTFYTLFGSTVPLPVPKCYRAYSNDVDGTGYLIMEDLAGCQEMNPYDGFSLDRINEIVDHLARLHCWSLNDGSSMTTTDWRSHFKHYYDFPSWYEYLHRMTCDTLNNLCDTYPTYFRKMDQSIIDAAFDKRLVAVPEGQGVLTHGDLWIHNILFDSISGRLAGFIDWQFVNIGNLVDDLARLMIYSVRTDIRRQNEISVLKRYHERMKDGLNNSSLLPDFDSLLTMYKTRFACEAISIVCDYSLLTEECLQRQIDDVTKQKDLEELLYRGSATLNDAESILNSLIRS